MNASLRTILTFAAGLAVGGAAILLAPTPAPPPGAPAVPPGGGLEAPLPGGTPKEPPPPLPPAGDDLAALPPPPEGLPPSVPGEAPVVPVVPAAPALVNDGAVAARLAGRPEGEVPGATVLQDHVAGAAAAWRRLAEAADRDPRVPVRTAAGEMRRVADLVPGDETRFPPLQDVVILLVEERLLVDRLRGLGFDTGELGREVDVVLTRTVGRIPGGAQKRASTLGVDEEAEAGGGR